MLGLKFRKSQIFSHLRLWIAVAQLQVTEDSN